MTNLIEIIPFVEEKKKQDKEFLEKVQVRNEKEAKLIIAKYDLRNSCLYITTKFFGDYERINEEYHKQLQKRKEFLNFMSEYL